MNLQVEPPEKKTNSSSPPPSFSLLPDDITVNYLVRISRPYYPRLSTVSKSFKSILSSSEIYVERSRLGTTEYCLYVSILDNRFPQWFRLWINPNRTLHEHDSSLTKEKTLGNLLVPIPSTDIFYFSELVVGPEIYVIGREIDGGPSSVVRILDCRTHTWRDAPSMNIARECPASCFYDGKIYVFGGYKGYEDGWRKELEDDEPWAEVFDTKTHTWELLPEPGTEIRECLVYRIAEIEGKIYFDNNRGSVRTMYSYDPKQGKWENCGKASDMFLSSKCVIENLSYSCREDYNDDYGPFRIWWYDIKVGEWKRVKGLESFQEKNLGIDPRFGIDSSILVSCGGKLLLVWEVCTIRNDKKIWCAVIKVEKRDEGEVWGQVEWDDVLLTIPTYSFLLHCFSVSV